MSARRFRAANIAKVAGANSTNARSVVTPLNPRRRMRTRWRLVLRIRLTIAAEPSRGFHALLKGREAAICTAHPTIVNRAPRIVLGFSGFFDAEDGYQNSRNEQQKPHGRLLLAPCRQRQPHALVSSSRAREGARRISPSCRSHCASRKLG